MLELVEAFNKHKCLFMLMLVKVLLWLEHLGTVWNCSAGSCFSLICTLIHVQTGVARWITSHLVSAQSSPSYYYSWPFSCSGNCNSELDNPFDAVGLLFALSLVTYSEHCAEIPGLYCTVSVFSSCLPTSLYIDQGVVYNMLNKRLPTASV